MGNENKQNRYGWVDVIKGVSILFIMLGHVLQTNPVKTWFSSFHVASFFIVSGFLISMQDKSQTNFKKTIKKNVIPYLFFSILAIIVQILYIIFISEEKQIHSILIMIYKTITGYGIGALWFIPSYIIGQWIFIKSKIILNDVKKIFIFLSTIVFAIITDLVLHNLIINLEYTPLYQMLYYPIISLVRGCVCSFYFYVGSILVRFFKWCLTKEKQNLLVIAGIISMILNVLLSQFGGITNFSMLFHGKYPILLYINGVLGSIGLIFIIYNIFQNKKNKILEFFGRNSLILMGTHMSLMLPKISSKIVTIFWPIPHIENPKYYIYGLSCLLVMIIIEYPIIIIINKKLSFILGKGRGENCVKKK